MIFLLIIGAVVAGIIARFVTMDWLRKQFDGGKTYAAGVLAFLVTMLIVFLAGLELI